MVIRWVSMLVFGSVFLMSDGACANPAIVSADGASRWSDYEIIMWQEQSAEQYKELGTIGVTGAAMTANRDAPGHLTVDSRSPTVLAIAPNYPPRIEIVGPTQILLGNEGKYEVSLASGSAKDLSVLHVSLIDP